MRLLILIAVLSGCSNEAISFAKMLSQDAECESKNLYNHGPDTAVCKFQGKIWWCDGGGHKSQGPSCTAMDPMRVEKQ